MKTFSKETKARMSASAKARCTPEWRAAKSAAYSTPLPVDELSMLYAHGMSQDELAARYSVSQKVIWSFMRRHKIKTRKAAKRNQNREQNDSWKGSKATYAAYHYRMYALRGSPKKCEQCKTEDKTKAYDWANMTGKYDDPSDYKRLCRSCHRKHDKVYLNFKKGKEVDSCK